MFAAFFGHFHRHKIRASPKKKREETKKHTHFTVIHISRKLNQLLVLNELVVYQTLASANDSHEIYEYQVHVTPHKSQLSMKASTWWVLISGRAICLVFRCYNRLSIFTQNVTRCLHQTSIRTL